MNQLGSTPGYPVDVEINYPEAPSRLLALLAILFWLKALLLVPHFIVLWFLTIAAFIALVIAYWAVLITGRYPRSLFDFGVGVQRWQLRMNSWLFGWTDRYPPFSLK
jgi:hypothetical protein